MNQELKEYLKFVIPIIPFILIIIYCSLLLIK
jgi:hypothetical protein